MKKIMPKTLPLAAVLLLCAALALPQGRAAETVPDGERYRIIDTEYEITGTTREYALALNVPIDTDRIFASREELAEYIADIEQQLRNQRTIATAETSYRFLEPGADITGKNEGIVPVVLTIKTTDTFNFIILPYPKYNSNDGLDLRLKFKNYNFLGLMEVLTADIIYQWEIKDDGANRHSFGGALNFDLPFKVSIFDMKWLNDYSITYTIGENKPEFGAMTGLEITLQLDGFSIVVTAKQSANLDFEYTAAGDELYATEEGSIAVPIEIADINTWTKVKLTPDVHAKYVWDRDGIVHKDLQSPIVGMGYKLASARVNWIGNYRDGFAFEFGQKFDYNYHPDKRAFVPSIWVELQLFKAFRHFALVTRLYLKGIDNGTEKIGERLRGIRDDQNGIETSHMFVANIDLPIKLFRTDWRGWGRALFKKEMPNFFSYLDFEFQIAPFIDIAFSHIDVPSAGVDRTFDYKDGWYAGGLEVLVFPERMRSIVVRASFGVDIARTLGFVEKRLDTSWRSGVSRWELSIGVGLFF
jgi:hypothetical protein